MRDGGRDIDGADGEGGAGGERGNVDVGEVDDREGAEGEGVFGVGYRGDEVCDGRSISKSDGEMVPWRHGRSARMLGARAHAKTRSLS